MKQPIFSGSINFRSMRVAAWILLMANCYSSQEAAAATFAPTETELNASPDRPAPDLSRAKIGVDATGRRFFEIDDKRYPADAVGRDNAFSGNLWPAGVVYYQFAPAVSDGNRTQWRTAAGNWGSVAGLTFTEGTGSGNYIYVQSSSANNSYVGMIGGRQDMSLSEWSIKVIAHEIGHALGLEHEHNRADRESFVIVRYNNILAGAASNFTRAPAAISYGPYDFTSIMHYDRLAASSNGQNTLEPQSPYSNYLYTMGTALSPSALDASGMAQRYPNSGTGAVVAQYTFPSSSFAMSPTQPYMYTTIPSENSIAIINTNTLAVEKIVFVGSGPANIAFSPDGLTAYIANSTSSFVVVFDTQSRTIRNTLLIPEQPRDVVVGNQNRLFVLGSNSIFQIDATTGASAGPDIGPGGSVYIYSGALEISPDRNSLYYGDYGLSPSSMYRLNVTTSTPTKVWESPHGPHGSNGQDLTLSHDGSFISYACGYGQGGYQIAKFRTADLATLGSFATGAYPREIAFSPDDLVAYTVHESGQIDVFDANTFLSLGQFMASGEASELSVDSSGRYLFAGYVDPFGGYNGTRVFDTGRTVQRRGLGDFNRDGHADIVWQNKSTGQSGIWLMDGSTWVGESSLPTVALEWKIAGTGDFSGDGQTDIVWQNNRTGERGIWLMAGTTYSSAVFLPDVALEWEIATAGDFNQDGQTDLVWENSRTGERGIWLMSGTNLAQVVFLPTIPLEWQIVAAGDFTGDRQTDLLWENRANGQRGVWRMNGTTFAEAVFLPSAPTQWRIAGTGDFNGNGSVDLLWQNIATGERGLWFMNRTTQVGVALLPTISLDWEIVNH